LTQSSALVLFSGGQDSAVCLAHALATYGRVETIGFSYGQRHKIEMETRLAFRSKLATAFPHWGAKLGEDHVLDLSDFGRISETALTRDVAIEIGAQRLPSTFVPGRNLLFFTYAAAVGWRRGITTLVGGMCETDYSGYPDCRNDTLQTLARALSLGMDKTFTVETPLMYVDKAGTWAMAQGLGGARLVDLIVEETHTCYLGIRTRRHDWGYGCNHCPACDLRRKGYEAWRAQAAA
jgi:7-cyano-7-deazaguanine synthase